MLHQHPRLFFYMQNDLDIIEIWREYRVKTLNFIWMAQQVAKLCGGHNDVIARHLWYVLGQQRLKLRCQRLLHQRIVKPALVAQNAHFLRLSAGGVKAHVVPFGHNDACLCKLFGLLPE